MIIFTSTVTNLYHLYFHVFFKNERYKLGGFEICNKSELRREGGLEIGENCERNLWMAPKAHDYTFKWCNEIYYNIYLCKEHIPSSQTTHRQV